ncbi:MAG: hypothetical protein K1X78_24130 [Verrucomicrobiaceae bacterium]|nr:hypothetical protein [Verrucomicrobiaceae bacterium]
MTRLNISILQLAVPGAILIASVHAQDKALLRPHWQAGKTYHQQTETQTTSTLTPAPGEFIEQKLNVVQKTEIRVVPEPGTANKRAEVKFAGMTGEMTFQGRTFKFDSADPQSAHPLLRQALAGTTGRSFAMIFDGEDAFVEVKGTERLAGDGATITGLGAMADARGVANLFRQSLEAGLSSKPVAPGDKWTTEQTIPFPQAGEMKVRLNSTYAENVQRDGRLHAKVTFEGRIGSTDTEPDEKGRGEAAASLSGESTLSGQVFFDLERRTVSLSVFLANLTLKLQGNRIPLRQQVTTRLASITDNAP